VAEPAKPVADAAGTCGTGGTLRRWVRKGARSLGSSPGSAGAIREEPAVPQTADAAFDADSDGDGLLPPQQGGATPADAQGTPDEAGVTVQVAFLLTAAAAETLWWQGEDLADQLCDGALKDADLCMVRSGIPVDFKYVGRGVYDYQPRDFDDDGTKEEESVDSVVADLDSDDPAGRDAISKIREQMKADLVCVVTGPFSGAAGCAPVITDWPVATKESLRTRAWIVLRSDTLQGNTFAHEVAHVLGSTHQPGKDPGGDKPRQHCWSRGWVGKVAGSDCGTMECQTIGTNGGTALMPLLFYSTADVQHRGVVVGEPHDPACTADTSSGAVPAEHAAHKGADSASTFRITAPRLAGLE
jgi:hypothetical protein